MLVFNDHVDLDDIDSDIIIFFGEEVGLNTIDFDDINLDDVNCDGDDPETIIHVRLTAWCSSYKQHKACKK